MDLVLYKINGKILIEGLSERAYKVKIKLNND